MKLIDKHDQRSHPKQYTLKKINFIAISYRTRKP